MLNDLRHYDRINGIKPRRHLVAPARKPFVVEYLPLIVAAFLLALMALDRWAA